MLVSFFPLPSSGGIVIYVNRGALSSILGLELPRKTERVGRDAKGSLLCCTARTLCG